MNLLKKRRSSNKDPGEMLNAILRNAENQRKSISYQLQNAECQIKILTAEKKMCLKEKNEMTNQLECLMTEKERLLKEINCQINFGYEKEELLKTVEALKSEKSELIEKVKTLHENIQELNNNYKETRWALTSEVAEKHDQVQELKRCVGALEEQLRQADMQTHFRDDIIKELRKELKASRKSERPGLYDVVNELKDRKSKCGSNVKFSKSPEMSKHQTGGTYNTSYCSGASAVDKEDKGSKDNEKLQSQIECLKKNLKAKAEELKRQEDCARALEEELGKAKIALGEFSKQDRQSMSCMTSTSNPSVTCHEGTLFCVVCKVEEILRELQEKHKSDLGSCKTTIEKEMEKVRSVKKALEKSKFMNQSFRSCDTSLSRKSDDRDSFCPPRAKYHSDSELPSSHCECSQYQRDIEKFREKALTGAVALEQMKEQIDILENFIKKNLEQLPARGDKTLVENCENKLGKFRREFDDVTYQLCQILQKFNKNSFAGGSFSSLSYDTVNSTEEDKVSTHTLYSPEEISRLKCEYQRLQKQVCDQENAAEKLKIKSKQLDEEIQQKTQQLKEHCKEMESKACEISRMRELVRKVDRRLRESQGSPAKSFEEENGPKTARSTSILCCLFCDLQELQFTLEKSSAALDGSQKLREDNEKLKEKLGCLEKCIYNKEEALRNLQGTVKMRESQIEELRFKMQTCESQTSKLAQDVEEKCRLIASLQDAVRKCKQFEVNMEEVEYLQFEYCELECKLEKCKKEILLRDQKLERLHNEITDLASKNVLLTEKLSIMDPKLKIMYKTSHLFERTVTDLEEELNSRECEIETLYAKIKELEAELESEFKKCENRALEDSKCIEELSLTVKNFQNELFCAQESYNMSISETENKLKKAMEMREAELNNTIYCLQAEIKDLQSQLQEGSCRSKKSPKLSNADHMFDEAGSQQEFCEKKIKELQTALECVTEEHEKERKSILQKLCEEKKENSQSKTLITKLNENVKRKMQHERSLKECIDRLAEESENLKSENQELRTEIEARKKIMGAMEKENGANLADLEELICSLKIQKAELRAKCCNLKAEVEKEIKLKRLLECRVEDLNALLQNKMQKFNEIIENYKCSSAKIQQTCERMKELEESLVCSQNSTRRNGYGNEADDYNNLKKLLDIKTAENAKLICQIQVLKVEIESIQSEEAASEANKDAVISRLQNEIECLANDLQEFQSKWHKANEENIKLQRELDFWTEKANAMQNEFRERQKDLCGKLRSTICEKNDLLNSLDELQKQLEQICLENVNKEKVNRELTEECSKLKLKVDSTETFTKNKPDKAVCNLTKEVKHLRSELSEMQDNYNTLNEEYQALADQYKCLEKKKCNLEKLYVEVNNENKELLETKENLQREVCELRSQNLLLKEMMTSFGEGGKNVEEKKKMCQKIKDLTLKLKTLEKKVIPNLEQEISDKICCINNLQAELRDANISSQRMRTEALRVIEHTRKYLSAQRCANETLKSRLECSNKRGNMLGVENRELEEQLKAVSRMNEFLLRQLKDAKDINGEAEPRSYSPLPWGCPTVERDTSSSEYLAESGFQSMQPSPTNLDYDHEIYYDTKRSSPQWSNSKKSKCGGSVEFLSYRNGVR